MKTEKLQIDALAYGGDGVGHLSDGRACFVAGAFPGDTVEVALFEDKERFARGRVESFAERSAERVKPTCPLAADGTCGGCPWAPLFYERQLFWKRQALVDALVHIAKFDASKAEELVEPCVASNRTWGYRNKVEFVSGLDVAGRFTLGMHARSSNFVPLSSCKLCDARIEKAPKALTGALRYAMGDLDLKIERVGVRFSRRTHDTEIAIWTAPGRFPRAAMARVLSEALPVKHAGVTRVLVKGDAKKRKIAGVESLAGHGYWTERIAGRTMALSAPSFFQVNTAQAERLVDLVMEFLEPDGLDSVLDLYSGAGTFTLPLAERAGVVRAVEMEGSSVRDLRRNLDRNNLAAEVIGGDVERELADLGMVDKVVVDPPRSGLGGKVVSALVATRAARIAYVSCNPTTLARDLKGLCAAGYELVRAVPVDLFPQTYHVETVCLLARD
ncbi:MAG: 23S rRNA (uracil(1939)-C(5))-methyltransferase RlmD [Coriobacteriales bacterium]|jgi:23S rRNA (uracil1939-C5)-methyltransferase